MNLFFGGGGNVSVKDDGVLEGVANVIDFVGAGVSVTHSNGVATVTVSGSSATLDTDNNLVYAYNPLNAEYDGGADATGVVEASGALQAALEAACDNLPAKLIINGKFRIAAEVFNNSTRLQPPYITSVDTTTEIITFNKAHGLKSGDPFEVAGHLATGLSDGTLYFAYAASPTTIKAYTTQTDALTDTGSNKVNITGATTTTISSITSTTVFEVASTLNAQKGTAVLVSGGSTSSGGAFITNISGNTITVNRAITGMVNGATVTFVGELAWQYWNVGLDVEFTPGSGLFKDTTYSGNGILTFLDIPKVSVKGGFFYGQTYGFTDAISAGDDGLRFMSCRQVHVEDCKFMFFGDSAIRAASSTRKYLATTTGEPYQGVSSSNIRIKNNYFDAIEQISTTTDDYFHGGSSEYWLEGNIFNRIRGSIKFANRVPGGRSLWIKDNKFLSSEDKFLEIDSYENVWIRGNEFWDCVTNAIYMLSNDGTSGALGLGIVGFEYGNLDISKNYFNNTGSGASSYACLRMNPDSYTDGSRFEYRNINISDNTIENISNTSHIAFNFLNGSYQNLSFLRNTFQTYQGATPFKLLGRGSTVSGFKNNIRVEGNNFNMNNASATAVWIERSGGTEKLNLINIKNNIFTGTATRLFLMGDLKNITISGNRADVTNCNFFLLNSGSINEMHVYQNELITTSTFGWNLASIDGLYMWGNYMSLTAGSSGVSFQNTCQNVWYFNNKMVGGLETFRQVPINSKALGKTGRREDGTATPTSGTWRVGDIIDKTDTAAGGSPGWYCTTAGTAGTLSSVTATTTASSTTVTVSSGTNIANGTYITIAGVTGTKRVVSGGGTTTLIVDVACDASVGPGAAVAYSAPTFKTLATIA